MKTNETLIIVFFVREQKWKKTKKKKGWCTFIATDALVIFWRSIFCNIISATSSVALLQHCFYIIIFYNIVLTTLLQHCLSQQHFNIAFVALSYTTSLEHCLSNIVFYITTSCRNPTWKECEDDTHTPEMETWESFGTPKNSGLDFRGQNTSPWCVLYTVEKVLKRRCRKWPRMSHSDICSTSYVQKKGRESNCQFDSRPLKAGNRPDAGVCRWSATHCWKALKESYKFAWDLIPIGGLSKELWATKVLGIQIGIVSGLLLGSPGKKCHSDVGVAE
jgi:hypothetical protein